MPDAPLPPLPPVGQPRWRTVADDLVRRLPAPWVGIALVFAAVAVALVAVAQARSAPAGTPAPPGAWPAAPEPAVRPGPGGSTTTVEPEEVVVDVSGAVARRGLVRLRTGARVADAIGAAGGPAPDADLTAVNQARVVADGEQVRVPRQGEPVLPPPPANGPAGTPTSAPAAPVDLNRATPAELDLLPGIGPATAAAIVTWREENGGFRRVDDLLEVPGIGPTRLERLRPHVRV